MSKHLKAIRKKKCLALASFPGRRQALKSLYCPTLRLKRLKCGSNCNEGEKSEREMERVRVLFGRNMKALIIYGWKYQYSLHFLSEVVPYLFLWLLLL